MGKGRYATEIKWTFPTAERATRKVQLLPKEAGKKYGVEVW